MSAIGTILGPPHMDAAGVQLDLRPFQIAQLRGTQAVTIGNQDRGRVPMAVPAVLAGGIDKPLDLLVGQVFPLPQLGVRPAARYCPIYDGRRSVSSR